MKKCLKCSKKFATEAAVRMHVLRAHGNMGPQGKPWPQKTNRWKRQREAAEAPKSILETIMDGVALPADVAPETPVEKIPMPEATTVGALVSTKDFVLPRRLPTTGVFKCPACPVTYTYSNSFRNHIRMKHPEIYETSFSGPAPEGHTNCPECGKIYKISTISTHLRNMHGIYQLGPRNPKNKDKVVRRMPKGFYNGNANGKLLHNLIPETPETETKPEFSPEKFLAIKIQALVQLGEVIANLKG